MLISVIWVCRTVISVLLTRGSLRLTGIRTIRVLNPCFTNYYLFIHSVPHFNKIHVKVFDILARVGNRITCISKGTFHLVFWC